jgi:membrane-associated two-gene conflict system component 1 (EACC1)
VPEGDARDVWEIALAVSDPAQLASLREWLGDQPGVQTTVVPGVPGPGEQGGLDALSMLVGSGGLIAALRVLPEFIRSRRSGFRVEATVRGEKIVMDAENVEQVLPILDRILRD